MSESDSNSIVFFFSYAHADMHPDLLGKVLGHLKEEVRSICGSSRKIVCFRDVENINPGEQWDTTIFRALCNSAVFVFVATPAYFDSDVCGKEWFIFTKRFPERSTTECTEVPESSRILPIVWEEPEHFSDRWPSKKHYGLPNAPDDYARHGLRSMRQKVNSGASDEDYRNVIRSLANAIKKAARSRPHLSPSSLDPKYANFDNVPSAFDLGHRINAASLQESAHTVVSHEVRSSAVSTDSFAKSPQATVSDKSGPTVVRFYYVVGTDEEIRTCNRRQELAAYGPDRERDWKPLNPDLLPATVLAQNAASSEKLTYDPVWFENVADVDKFLVHLDSSERKNIVAVLLVDIWSLHVSLLESIMKAYDTESYLNCIVIAPWNPNDGETELHGDGLREKWRDVFRRQDPKRARIVEVINRKQFVNKIKSGLCHVRKRMYERGPVCRIVKASRYRRVPTIGNT